MLEAAKENPTVQGFLMAFNELVTDTHAELEKWSKKSLKCLRRAPQFKELHGKINQAIGELQLAFVAAIKNDTEKLKRLIRELKAQISDDDELEKLVRMISEMVRACNVDLASIMAKLDEQSQHQKRLFDEALGEVNKTLVEEEKKKKKEDTEWRIELQNVILPRLVEDVGLALMSRLSEFEVAGQMRLIKCMKAEVEATLKVHPIVDDLFALVDKVNSDGADLSAKIDEILLQQREQQRHGASAINDLLNRVERWFGKPNQVKLLGFGHVQADPLNLFRDLNVHRTCVQLSASGLFLDRVISPKISTLSLRSVVSIQCSISMLIYIRRRHFLGCSILWNQRLRLPPLS